MIKRKEEDGEGEGMWKESDDENEARDVALNALIMVAKASYPRLRIERRSNSFGYYEKHFGQKKKSEYMLFMHVSHAMPLLHDIICYNFRCNTPYNE